MLQAGTHHALHLLGARERGFDRCVRRHVHVDIKKPHRVEREELEPHHAKRRCSPCGGHGQYNAKPEAPGPAQEVEQRPAVLEAQLAREAVSHALHARRPGEIEIERRDVGRQHPERLDEADAKRERHHKRDHEHELADDAGHQHQRQKRGQRGGDGGADRRSHLAQAIQTRREHLLAALDAIVDCLDYHNRVVDQHAERDDHAEQHRDIESEAGCVQHRETAGERERNTEPDQDGNAHTQKHPADGEHQRETEDRVRFHHVYRRARRDGLVVGQAELEPGRCEQRVLLGHIGLDAIHQFERIGIALLGHREQDRRIAFARRKPGRRRAPARNAGERVDRHTLARSRQGEREFGEVAGIGVLSDDAHDPRIVAYADLAGEGVAKPCAHGIGKIAGVEAARCKLARFELDLELRVVHAEREHQIDAGQPLQVGADRVRGAAHHLVVGVPGEQHLRGGESVGSRDLQDARIVFHLRGQFGAGLVLYFAPQVGDALVEHTL